MYQYSNSLIRQFPSLVTGNAAVGVQATVYVGETNTLAQLFEVNGAAKSNPVTTNDKGFYSFSLADGDYRIVFSSSQFATLRISVLDGAQIREDFEDLVASNAVFKNEQQAAYDAFVLSQGWDQVGTFAAGFTYTSPNQVGQDADGNWWRWNGALPKVVTAGTLPSSDANYKLVGDGVLRKELGNFFFTADSLGSLIPSVNSSFIDKKVQWLGYYDLSDGGSGWGIVKSGSYTADGGSIIAVGPSLYIEQNLKGSSINVRKFGAKGDGVAVDNVAFQSAANYLSPLRASTIKVPAGEYIIDPSAPITFPNVAFSVVGEGMVILRQLTGSTSGFMFDFSSCSGPPKVIENIQFLGQESGGGPRNIKGIKLAATNGLTIRKCWGRVFDTFIDGSSADCSYIEVVQCAIENSTTGIIIKRCDESIFSDLIFYDVTNMLEITQGSNAAMTANATVIGKINGVFCYSIGIKINQGFGTTIGDISINNEPAGLGANIKAIVLNGGAGHAVHDITLRANPSFIANCAVENTSSKSVINNIAAKSAQYVVNSFGSDNCYSNITGQSISDFGVFLQSESNSSVRGVKIDGCTNGLNSASTANCYIDDFDVKNNSGAAAVFTGTTNISVNNSPRLSSAMKTAVAAGVRFYNADATYTGYSTTAIGAPTWAIGAGTRTQNEVGDRCVNITPAVGSPKGWVCTVAGSPGTWVSEGIL